MRFDLKTIAALIAPGATVLDLGCGDGELLFHLKEEKNVDGIGVEKDEAKVARCIERGLSVIHGDINEEILDYPSNAFNYVILSRTLQQVYDPAGLIRSLLRVGEKGIVSFPNFGHWRVRWQLLCTGYAPVTRQLPFQWHDTPNIRVITLKDFQKFSRQTGSRILNMTGLVMEPGDARERVVAFLPNLRATYGIFLIGKM